MMAVLHADRDQIARFVATLFAYADENTFVSLRAFDQTDRSMPPKLIRAVEINGKMGRLVDEAVAAAEEMANETRPIVFAPPICTFSNPDRARVTDLANGLTLSVEVDEGNIGAAKRRLETLFGPCTVVVESGGEWSDPLTGEIHPKLHLHWRLSEPTRADDDHSRLRQARDLAARLVGADPTGKPVVHPLRWPGSWNRKGAPRLARIVAFSELAEIDLGEALERVEEAIEAAGIEQTGDTRSGTPQAAMGLVKSAMAAIPNPRTEVHYDQWIRLGYAAYRATGGSAEGYVIWDDWSRKSGKYNGTETEAAWKRIRRAVEGSTVPRTIGAGTIFYFAGQAGWERPPPFRFGDDRGTESPLGSALRVGHETPADDDDHDPQEQADGQVIHRRDLLKGVVEKTATDPTAAFASEVLKRLAVLKQEDRAAFETLRSNLKKAGCRVTALDEAIAKENGDVVGRGLTQADILIELTQSAELFHTPDGGGFADLNINGHRETWPIRAKGFRRWLARRFFEATHGAPSSEALQSALNVIEARAHFDAPERMVHVRVGGLDDKLYLDLGDEAWRAVEIDASGWRVIDNPPVRFRRAAGMQPLSTPVSGGSITKLRPFLNVKTDTDFVLVVTWVLAALRDRGPYPVLVLSGEQGSAKSTFCAILRALLDPNTAPLRALPREERDLFIAAINGHVLAFDNVSALPVWISDTLCRLATGGGFAVRQLYTDQDEVLFEATRPVILNGIEDIVSWPDLADRGVFQTLEQIPEEHRRAEKELWATFELERPHILGALLSAVAHGLKRLPETRLEKLPRMADFALWATACETALWPAGTFWSAYCGNRDEAVEGVIDADPIASAVRAVMLTQTEWTGTASDLLGALAVAAGERIAKSKTWPDSPRALSGRLRRAATFLRKVGIEISFGREGRARLARSSSSLP